MSGLRRVLDAAAPGLRAALATDGVAPGAAATPLAVAAHALARPFTVALTATSTDAETLRVAVGALLGPGDEVALFPGWDTHPLERVSPDASAMAARALLRHRLEAGERPRVVVAPVRALAQWLAPGDAVAPLVVTAGGACDRDDLVAWLARAGYRREGLVEHRGEFAVRGGIVDVWPAQSEWPVRVDLFGDEVDRLGTFDIANQRSRADLESAVVAPAREWVPDGAARAGARALADSAPWGRAAFDRIAEGHLFDGMEGWMTLVGAPSLTLLDAAPDASVVVVDPARARHRLDDLLAEERELADTVAATWRADREVPLLHAPWDTVIGGRDVVAVEPGPEPGRLRVAAPPVVQGDPARLAAHVRGWPARRRGVVLTAGEATALRVADALRAEGLDVTTRPEAVLDVRVSVIESALPAGFALDDPDVVVWSETDLTGRRAVHRAERARARSADGFFDDLAVGSHVVHRQHGVARFSGTTTRAINGVVRDYLILEFRDGRSYWPTEQIDALTPYAGGDSPALSRLGGAEWQRTRAKARAAAYLVAQELVALYRQRAVAAGHAFAPDSAWQREMEDLFAYTLTADQARAIDDVKADMEAPRPMDRLLCADVGFGKTEVAVRAVFKAVQDGKQAAVLVPTTLLASQHLATFAERFAGFPVRVALLSRFVDDAEAAATVRGLADGSVDVVVGTHRLLGGQVRFKDLGLLVVDEEQRFGVAAQGGDQAASVGVDVLTLTASPDPAHARDGGRRDPRPLDDARRRRPTGARSSPTWASSTRPPWSRRCAASCFARARSSTSTTASATSTRWRAASASSCPTRASPSPTARWTRARSSASWSTSGSAAATCWSARRSSSRGSTCRRVNTLIVDRAERLGLGQLHQLRGRVGRGAPARLRLPLPPRRPRALRDRLRAPAHDRRQHRAGQRLQDRHARPRDPRRRQPARPRPVRARGRGRLRPLRPAGRRGGRPRPRARRRSWPPR